MAKLLNSLLAELTRTRREYGKSTRPIERLFARLNRVEFMDAESLLHFHDMLLFLRAFPPSRRVAFQAENLLRTTSGRVALLQKSGDDLSLFESEEFSGLPGTLIRDCRTFDLVRWLVGRYPNDVSIEWDFDAQARRLAVILPQVVPLLADDSFVEADTPYGELMSLTAGGEARIPKWLVQNFEKLDLSTLAKTGLFDGLEIQFAWKLNAPAATRTLARRPSPKLFVHKQPLLQRKDVSLDAELASPDLPVRKLSRKEDSALLDFVREALLLRYRELHGTTHCDASYVYEADAGRGVLMYLWGTTPEWRLPLRGYYAGITIKNGVPINYIEAIGLFEWMEIGFNTFYAYREGETAWVYSKALHLLHQLAGATCFSVYPYQLGDANEEAIASGAFWFYRKLGFRPGRPDLLTLTEYEESRMARDPKYRSSARILRKLAAKHVFYEFGDGLKGVWDKFSVRNIDRAVLRYVAHEFGGHAAKMRRETTTELVARLDVDLDEWNGLQREAFTNFACVLALMPALNRWSAKEKQLMVRIIRAKVGADETAYFRLLQRHERLRAALLKIGSE